MNGSPKAPRLRLPDRLAHTAIRVAVAGTLACSTGAESPKPADASADRPADAHYSDACPPGEQLPCTAVTPGATCPSYVCNPNDCPIGSGCEPII